MYPGVRPGEYHTGVLQRERPGEYHTGVHQREIRGISYGCTPAWDQESIIRVYPGVRSGEYYKCVPQRETRGILYGCPAERDQGNIIRVERIRSVPGNKVLPVSSSAMMHPTDQMSTTVLRIQNKNRNLRRIKNKNRYLRTPI